MKAFVAALSCLAVVSAGGGGRGYLPGSINGIAGSVTSAHGGGFGGAMLQYSNAGYGSFKTVPAVIHVVPKTSYRGIEGGYRGHFGGGYAGGYESGSSSGLWNGKSLGATYTHKSYYPNNAGSFGGVGGYSGYGVATRGWAGKSANNFGSFGGYGHGGVGSWTGNKEHGYGSASASSSASGGWWKQ